MLGLKDIQAIFKSSPAPCLVLLPDAPHFTIVEVNKAYLKITNTGEGDLINKSIFDAFPENPGEVGGTGVKNLRASLEQVIATKATHKMAIQKYDIPVRGTQEFEVRYWSPENSPVLNEKGEVDFIIHAVMDVTDSVLSEEKEKKVRSELLKNQEHYRSLFDHNPNAVFSFDLEGNFLSANDALARLAECSVEELLEITFVPFVAPEDVEKVFYHFKKAATGETQNYDTGMITAKGHRLIVNVTNLPIVVNNEIIGVYGIAKDITKAVKAEQTIKNNEQRFRTLLQNSTEGFAVLAVDGTVLEMSPSAKRMLGYEANEIVEKIRPDRIHSEDLPKVNKAFTDVINDPDHAKITIEYRFLMPDSGYKWIESSFHNQLNEPAVGAIVLNYRDITEKKLSEIAIRKSEEVRRLIMKSALDAIIGMDTNGDVILWNPQAEKIFGWKEEEIIGKHLADYIIPHQYRERHEAGIKHYLQTGEGPVLNKHLEITALNYRQKEFPVELTIIPIKQGGTEFFCAFVRDITERKKAAEALRQSEERYHKMVEEVKDYAIILLNSEGVIENWNKGAENLKGYKAEEIIGQNFSVFYQEKEREEKLPKKLLAEASKKGSALLEGWRVRKDGSIFWGSIVITALHDEDNNVIGFTKVTRDLTERKEAEDKLISYANELKKSNEELEQFAYIASHDLQEPLRMVTSFLTQLEKKYKEQLDDKGKQYIHFAVDGATRMRRIILDLLEYSRVGRKEYEIEKIDMNELLNEVVQLNRTMIEEKGAVIEWENLPTIYGGKTPLQQVLQNLIGNGLKYQKPDGKPLIQVSATETARHWQFSVSDNGIGIEPQFFDKIFVVFQRLHNKDEYSGTGLGLAVCKKIVENHQGKIWVASVPGEGSTFYFTISKQLNKT